MRPMPSLTRGARLLLALPFVLALLSCSTPSTDIQSHADAATPAYQVEIRRTALGIPHLKADDWGSLGYGYGYVQAQDNLCTMADAFVTYRGERSRYFGAKARPSNDDTFGQPSNLDADFFFRFIDDGAAVARYRNSQTPEMRALIDGFASGYNRYVDELAKGEFVGAHAACRSAPWVGKISTADIYRRLYTANLAAGAGRFVSAIATAQPPGATPGGAKPMASATSPQGSPDSQNLASTAPLMDFGGHAGVGSNGLAFGADATHNGSAILFGNPHWFWSGPARFYQAQLTIPGKLDVSGVSFLGSPVIEIGFNRDVAWTHTVSTASRFGLFQLSLVPGLTTSYRYDGQVEAMTPTRVTVEVRSDDGTVYPVTRTLYRSRFGPMLNLSSMSPALAWNTQQAFALRDIDADNFRVFENFLDWNQARSLDDFIRIQKRNAAVPWVNTLAIGRGDPRVWYADIGAIPNAPDSLVERCTPPVGKAFAHAIPGVPVLDGTRSDCDWQLDRSAVQPGAMPVAQMPSLLRRDYVGNFNGSFWLSNPAEPLTGYARVIGPTDAAQSLRTRLGHTIAAQLQADPAGVSPAALQRAALDSRSMSAILFKQPVLDRLCVTGNANDLQQACAVLAAWNDTADADARGATLWNAFWEHLRDMPAAQLYAVPFDPKQPLTTPAGIAVDHAKLATAMQAALADMHNAGIAIDAPRSAALYVQRNDERIPLFGGCDTEGYFTAACAQHPFDTRGDSMNVNPNGNSYLQVVRFEQGEVVADTLLASSESDDPASPHYADGTREYASKHWMRVPFSEEAIAHDPALVTQVLTAPAADGAAAR